MSDREKLARILFNSPNLSTLYNSFDEFEEAADHLIANSVVVREKGDWIEDGYYGNPFVCSYCGHEGCYSGNYDDKDYYYTNFCPNCGADMRKGENNG